MSKKVGGPKSRYLYMLVTKDKYELPIMVEDSPSVLAKKLGENRVTIMSACIQAERGKVIRSKYRRVLIEDDNEEV